MVRSDTYDLYGTSMDSSSIIITLFSQNHKKKKRIFAFFFKVWYSVYKHNLD